MERLTEFFGGAIGLALLGSFIVGEIYWIWMSIQLGSFFMFFIGIAGPTMLFTAPVGAWSFFFGIPNWVINFFL